MKWGLRAVTSRSTGVREWGPGVPRRFLRAAALALAVTFVGEGRAGSIPGQYIVVLKDGVDGAVVAAEHARSLGAAISHRYQYALNGYAARLSAAARRAIEADDRVLFVSEDAEVFAANKIPPPQPQPNQILPRGIDRIDGDRSSTRSGDGKGVVDINVAVLDSGIWLSHPDLNVVGGINCHGAGASSDFGDVFGHGTFVAGIIGAVDDTIGVVGVAPGARLWSVRVLGSNGNGSTSAIVCGVDFVTASRSDSNPDNDIAVSNMSLGGKGSDDGNCGRTNKDALHLAICNSVAAGVTYVAGAGNDAEDFQNATPAAYDEVLTATAMSDYDGQPGGLTSSPPSSSCFPDGDDTAAASFSNFATLSADQAHTIAAPGNCIVSTSLSGNYAIGTGTSSASPHVAGTVALCIANGACAGLTPAQITQKLVNDAAAYNTTHPAYGFAGDPLQPEPGKYYGFLVRAGLY